MSVNEMQFGILPERGIIGDVFIYRRLQEENHAKGKTLHMCLVDQVKAFDRVPSNMLENAMRKKGIPEVLVRSMMSLYEGAKQDAEWIMYCQKGLRLEWKCTKDLGLNFYFCSCG